ncbi:hypothetical protein AYI69_g1391 [Smittium culicis]|uniref:Restriction endonuclease type IV Mrr domain-containing protein n=1 Tax=Smittium culicis TaxID=133412 RepID=A0A1R1YQH0_9FUNG|nr:hypothetical protein AYI69_g1391 [Smittium culicis]
MLGANLKRNGGANDLGIDFSGFWKLDPLSNNNIYLVGQCKNYSSTLGPAIIREFEGVMSRQNENDTVGILSCPNGFSAKAIETAMSSKYPLSLLTIRFNHNENSVKNINSLRVENKNTAKNDSGIIESFIWNRVAVKFFTDLVVTQKYTMNNTLDQYERNVSIIYKDKLLY